MVGYVQVGQITSAIWSPRLNCNVGQSMIARGHWDAGQPVTVHSQDGKTRSGQVSDLPFA
jgi:dimethylsulfoniopropionate demethylase